MTPDFEQLVGDTRYWLRVSGPKLTIPGLVRPRQVRATTENPPHVVVGSERYCSLGSRKNTIGSLAVTYGVKGDKSTTSLNWYPEGMFVSSPLTGNGRQPVALEGLAGVTKERLYNQLAIPMQAVLDSLK